MTGASKLRVQIPLGRDLESRYAIKGARPGCGAWEVQAADSMLRIFWKAVACSAGGSV